MEAISISSSPDPSPVSGDSSCQSGFSRKRSRLVHPPVDEIIEISDSDEELPVPPMFKRFTCTKSNTPDSSHLNDADARLRLLATPLHPASDAVLPGNTLHPLTPPPGSRDPPTVPTDPRNGYVERVIDVVPDVQPAHVLNLVEKFISTNPSQVVEQVLHALFEDSSYPKINRKGKRKIEEITASHTVSPPKIDYLNGDREYNVGPHYIELSLRQLLLDYPRIPKPHIRRQLLKQRFYALTFFALADELNLNPPPFKLKTRGSFVLRTKTAKQDLTFTDELAWVKSRAVELANQVPDCDENGIECGCCFSTYTFENMIQCPEAHLFCITCAGCKLPFQESELKRCLSAKLLELYERVKQRKEIEAAKLENLQECPCCEYKCVIENEMEKLFRCENPECAAVTCRTCKKPDHLPRRCEELEDQILNAQHVVDEAMTRALMRNCPKCQTAFVKEEGCNKMRCPECNTTSCYNCRQVIHGYDHFIQNTPGDRTNVKADQCILWDSVEQRHANEVSAAAKVALEGLKSKQTDNNENAIKTDVPRNPWLDV